MRRDGPARPRPLGRAGYELDTLADDLAGLADHLDLRDVTVVAHRTGTCEATRRLGRRGSGRVARMVSPAA